MRSQRDQHVIRVALNQAVRGAATMHGREWRKIDLQDPRIREEGVVAACLTAQAGADRDNEMAWPR